MSDIQFVDHSTVQLVKHSASDFDVAKAAWVSNFSNGDSIVLPDFIKSPAYAFNGEADEYRATWDKQYANDLSRVKGLINFLYRERHMSPFEHGSFTFYIDTPIFVAREFMRHRTFSYNETSGRYKELEPRFYLIKEERHLVQSRRLYLKHRLRSR